ncbi:MAG: hypothetical protein DRN04_05445 [Thermoprotei archaeon]|nr:MAG: hypothetical protein DRN04_05445 [Thermoprotei archaeon]
MILPGAGEPIIDPRTWIKMSNFEAPCDRCLLAFIKTPLDIGKKIFEEIEESMLKIPTLGNIKGRYKGVDVCVAMPYFGAPAAVMALELLIAAGVKKFIVYGGAGAIHPSVKIFDIIVPTWDIREEGTSYHYLPSDVIPKPRERIVKILNEKLSHVAQKLGVQLHTGGIWTTDAIFRETKDKVTKYSSMNILAIDMESTALMSVAMFRGVDLGIALIITDELYRESWKIFSGKRKMARIEEVVKTLFEVLVRI